MAPLTSAILLVELILFALLLAWGAWAVARLLSPPLRRGRVVAVEEPTLGGMGELVSERYHLRGKPDELRRDGRGRVYPVELKSGRSPRQGAPHPSHRIQVLAYCLLLEETQGESPPFGLLIYGDGSEFTVAWDPKARAEVLSVLEEWRRPYAGAMDPAPGKCHSCAFRTVCPGARTVGAAP